MSRFSGVQGKHARRRVKIEKRVEAELRDEQTPLQRRRWYRLRTAEIRKSGWGG